MRGTMVDVVVDTRVASPTYGDWEMVTLDDKLRNAVYLSEGLGHAFMALEDQTVSNYLCSTLYAPGREHGVNPLDDELGIAWPTMDSSGRPLAPRLSDRDLAAPGLSAAQAEGLLPDYDAVVSFVSGLD